MTDVISIPDLLKAEQATRKAGLWFDFIGHVTADNGKIVLVRIKAHRLYQQIFRVERNPVDFASGHSIHKVRDMHDHIRNTINGEAQ